MWEYRTNDGQNAVPSDDWVIPGVTHNSLYDSDDILNKTIAPETLCLPTQPPLPTTQLPTKETMDVPSISGVSIGSKVTDEEEISCRSEMKEKAARSAKRRIQKLNETAEDLFELPEKRKSDQDSESVVSVLPRELELDNSPLLPTQPLPSPSIGQTPPPSISHVHERSVRPFRERRHHQETLDSWLLWPESRKGIAEDFEKLPWLDGLNRNESEKIPWLDGLNGNESPDKENISGLIEEILQNSTRQSLQSSGTLVSADKKSGNSCAKLSLVPGKDDIIPIKLDEDRKSGGRPEGVVSSKGGVVHKNLGATIDEEEGKKTISDFEIGKSGSTEIEDRENEMENPSSHKKLESQHTRDLRKITMSPSFIRVYGKPEKGEIRFGEYGRVSRKKIDRELLHGFDCHCCTGYYNALGLDSPERLQRIDQVSKHRAVEPEPRTPEYYWEVRMADREEQCRRGQIAETESPAVLKPRLPHYVESRPARRRLFQ